MAEPVVTPAFVAHLALPASLTSIIPRILWGGPRGGAFSAITRSRSLPRAHTLGRRSRPDPLAALRHGGRAAAAGGGDRGSGPRSACCPRV
ncbi:hypothetical protein FHR81_000586 [Actinoalloteichus hoggarensis]|uniref:Uncharacterized protein n=1 Tax=Actinoalloteichus hoggarensis TaxID=1470176 RepID=A0A221W1X9_9PSEU|nr:hypothetical protein AHOG_10470 [Actinoalloteichus hoggarensis]MBB5919557.1 hypothetical protein [Actinoalloteichus hoggarensis]